MTDIRSAFAALHHAVDAAAKHDGREPHEVASVKASLHVAELVVNDLRRIADATEALANAQ